MMHVFDQHMDLLAMVDVTIVHDEYAARDQDTGW